MSVTPLEPHPLHAFHILSVIGNQACAAAACHSTRFLKLRMGVLKHAAACRSTKNFALFMVTKIGFSSEGINSSEILNQCIYHYSDDCI